MDNPWASPWDSVPAWGGPEHPSDEKGADNNWGATWSTTPSEPLSEEHRPPDKWGEGRGKPDRTVPPELLDSLLRQCHHVSQEIWPASEPNKEDNPTSGLDDLTDIVALLAQLLPADFTLPPTVQFSETATARAMNEALKLTRRLPASASSPLSRLLASKGSLEWEKSIRVKQDIVPDTAHIGWRVLEKEDRLSTIEESKPKKTTSGLLSFWNRRVSAIQAAPVETPSEQSGSPPRSGLEGVRSAAHLPSSQSASPSNASTPPLPVDPVVVTAPTSSAVSRFLNRFSLTRGPQHGSLALSSDDLEFLSDIVPSASDLREENSDGGALDAFTAANDLSPLPPKLPPPIPPPIKQPTSSARPSSAFGFGTSNGGSAVGSALTALQTQGATRTSNVPVLIHPLSLNPTARTQSPTLSLKDTVIPAVTFGRSGTISVQQRLQPSARPCPQTQRVPPLLSIPPLLPPPPVSPPQTPRPGAFPSGMASGHSFTTRSTDTSSFHDSHDTDDEFSAFAFIAPPAPAPFPSSNAYPPHRSPSPPSPPPRRTYERTHYPNSSSTSSISILNPASQTSEDQLCFTGASISASLDSFDDFVSPPPAARGGSRQHTPSPPSLPTKIQSKHMRPSQIDTFATRVYHAHTPSQSSISPTVHTGLMSGTFAVPSVSHTEHQRTQGLVDHAATLGGLLWPNSPGTDEQKAVQIPSPHSSPKPLVGGDTFDLLGDGYTLGGGLEVPVVGGTTTDSPVLSPSMGASRAPFGVANGPGSSFRSRNLLQPTPPLPPSTSTPVLSFTSLPATVTNPGSLQPAKPKQTGGLSAQDLSFFEGL